MSLGETMSIFLGAFSIALAIISIWLSLYSKKEASEINQRTQSLLMEVRTDAKSIAEVAMPELRAYGDTMRRMFRSINGTEGTPELEFETIFEEKAAEIFQKIDTMFSDSDIPDIKSKTEALQKEIVNLKSRLVSEVGKFNTDITVDLSDLDRGKLRTSHSQFRHFQAFLDTLYGEFLHNRVKAWTDGHSWILKDASSGKEFFKKSSHDGRPLEEVGILPGATLKVLLLS